LDDKRFFLGFVPLATNARHYTALRFPELIISPQRSLPASSAVLTCANLPALVAAVSAYRVDRFAMRVVPPSASALISSLRGVGYSLETAIADLIDNSIAASAETVDIGWEWNRGDPVATILDDGHGMSEEVLVEAMRFGGTGPNAVRSKEDLGRFGLGLKTASLSQCRRVTVASKTRAGVASFTWDIDHICETGGVWSLIEGDAAVPAEALAILKERATGTLVVWQKVDFGRKDDRPDHKAFMRDLERLDRHLGMVFHRFIDGNARPITIRINGQRVKAWDPFLEANEATDHNPEQPIMTPGGTIRVRGFVLPHRDRFRSEAEFEKAGGPDGWTAQQGFYVYRQKRLLSAGGWLGLGGSRAWTRDEPSRLARIRIDIPNTADHDWRIDIRKAIARPPDAVRERLQRIAEDIRHKAREVFVHRGQYGPRAVSIEVSRIWAVNPVGARCRYTIRRDHKLVELVRDQLGRNNSALLDALLDLIQRAVPVDRVWLDVTEHGVLAKDDGDTDEIVKSALSISRLMCRAGIPFADAAASVASMDPFDQVEGLRDRLLSMGQETAQ
jgi:Histidine kinase-, DNA gyrase B-, and HSP90-like ATPase